MTLTLARPIPLRFVRAFLRMRGYKEVEGLFCENCGLDHWRFPFTANDAPFDHPMRFLWGHAERGHEIGFIACHYWTWETGSPQYPEYQEQWAGCRTFVCVWNALKGEFQVRQRYEDRDWS